MSMEPSNSDLAAWWRGFVENEINATVPKAVEYGSQDLIDLGRDCAGLLGRKVSDPEAIEYAIWFFLRGKLARWTAALRRGERVSADTIFDIGVYAKMIQRVRDAGSWPADQSLVPHRDWPESELAERVSDERLLPDQEVEWHRQFDEALDQSEMRETAAESMRVKPDPLLEPKLSTTEHRTTDGEGNPTTTNPPEGATRSQLTDWLRAEIDDLVRAPLFKAGFYQYNAAGELRSADGYVKVRIQYTGEEFQVRATHEDRYGGEALQIRIAPGMVQQNPDMLSAVANSLTCQCLQYAGPGLIARPGASGDPYTHRSGNGDEQEVQS